MIPSREKDDSIKSETPLHDDCSVCGTSEVTVVYPEWMVPGPWFHQGTGERFMIVEPCKVQGPGRIWHKGVAARGEMGQLECRTESMFLMTMKLTPKPERIKEDA